MALSGSSDFSVSGGDIVRAAYRVVYNVSSEYTLEAAELADGIQALNILIKNLMGPPAFLAKGLKAWQRKTASLTLAAKSAYSLKPTGGDLDIDIPVSVLKIMYKFTSEDTERPLTYLTYEQYFSILNKAAEGSPIQYSYNRELEVGTLNIYPVPTADIVSDGDTLEISYLTPLNDIVAQSDDVHFSQEWFRPLKWMLAQEMFPEAGFPIPQEVSALAAQALESANTVEPVETVDFFEPNNPNMW